MHQDNTDRREPTEAEVREVFGPGSNAARAQLLYRKNHAEYQRRKEGAIKRGILAERPQHLRGTKPAQAEAPTDNQQSTLSETTSPLSDELAFQAGLPAGTRVTSEQLDKILLHINTPRNSTSK